MLNRIFVVDSVTLTSTGTAVSSYVPWDQSTRKLPTQVVIKATGQGAYVRLSNDNSAATNADTLVQAGDHVVLSVQGRRWVSVLSDGASSTVNVGALSTGVSESAASLDLAFVDAGVLDPRVTFTRASTATYFDSAGVLQSAAIDQPRLDYNPATLAAQGLLIEEQRTNLLTYSEDLSNAVWTLTGQLAFGSGSILNDGVAPDGATTADKVVEDTSTGNHLIGYANITTSTTTTSSLSFFIKAAGRTTLSIRFGSQSIVNRMQANIDLNTGAVSSVQNIGTATGAECTATLLPNQWWRITASVNPNDAAATSMRFIIYPNGAASYTGDGVSGVYVWGAQLEAGAFPTSYIPTTTTALTRSADVASVNTLSPWYNATEGTLFAEFITPQTNPAANQALASFNDTSVNNRWTLVASTISAVTALRNTSGAGLISTSTANTFANGVVAKAALAISTGASLVLNGGTVATNASYAAPAVTQLQLGAQLTALPLNGYLRRITYYPRRLSNAELQALTV